MAAPWHALKNRDLWAKLTRGAERRLGKAPPTGANAVAGEAAMAHTAARRGMEVRMILDATSEQQVAEAAALETPLLKGGLPAVRGDFQQKIVEKKQIL